MSDTTNQGKKRPDFIAHAVRSQGNNLGPKFTKIGVGFTLKNGGVSVLYDASPLSGQIVLVAIDDELPGTISYSHPNQGRSFEVSMVREGKGGDSFWTEVGSAWRQEGYLSIQLEVVPTSGKVILTSPRQPK